MKGKWLLMLLGVVMALWLATIQGCGSPDTETVTLGCQDAHVTLLRGQSNCNINSDGNLECLLMNPCPVRPGGTINGQWKDLSLGQESFVISGVPEFATCNAVIFPNAVYGIKVTSDTKTGLMERFLVASSTANPVMNARACYVYNSDLGTTCTGPFECVKRVGVGAGNLFVTTAAPSPSGFKVGVQIPFDAQQGQVSVTVGNNVCLATISTTCAQLVPGGTHVLLTAVTFPPGTTKLGWNGVTCDISSTPKSCTFTVTKDTLAIAIFQ